MRTARTALLILALTATYASSALAQSTPPNFLVEFEGQFGASAEKFVALAKAMPEESYGWRPMEGVASVASVYMHVARYNYFYPEIALDVHSPMGAAEYDSWEAGVADKGKGRRDLGRVDGACPASRGCHVLEGSREADSGYTGAMSASGRSFSSS